MAPVLHTIAHTYLNYTTVEWVRWIFTLDPPGRHSYVRLGDGVPPAVFDNARIVLDAPVMMEWRYRRGQPIIPSEYDVVEAAYHVLVMHPAIALANRMLHANGTAPAEMYKETLALSRIVVRGTHHVDSIGDTYRHDSNTLLSMRWYKRGVCGNFAESTEMFASNALGAVSADVAITVGGLGTGCHSCYTRQPSCTRAC